MMGKTCQMCQKSFDCDTPKKRFCDLCAAIRRAETMDRNNAKTILHRSVEAKTRREQATCQYPDCQNPVAMGDYGRHRRYCAACEEKAVKDRKHRNYLSSRYGAPENWPIEDRRIKRQARPQCSCKRCNVTFEANGPRTKYCPTCAYEISIEKDSVRQVKEVTPVEQMNEVLTLREQKKKITEQIRLARLAMYEAHEAKQQKAKAS
jgi:hypothetical protein